MRNRWHPSSSRVRPSINDGRASHSIGFNDGWNWLERCVALVLLFSPFYRWVVVGARTCRQRQLPRQTSRLSTSSNETFPCITNISRLLMVT